jgi:hypothetical protein
MITNYKKTAIKISCIVILLAAIYESSSGQVKMSAEKLVLPTYMVEAPDKNPVFFRGEL